MNKIFCIGLNKTGTSSLHEALQILGFSSLHWGGQEAHRAVERANREGLPLLTYVEEFTAYSDVGSITTRFQLADRQYPGSKFILTVRPLEAWIDSRRRHVEKNQRKKEAGTYAGSFLEVDEEGWRVERSQHHERVRRYFADRPVDLLEIDITSAPSWEPLCSFLGCGVPDVPFPWRNRDPRRPVAI